MPPAGQAKNLRKFVTDEKINRHGFQVRSPPIYIYTLEAPAVLDRRHKRDMMAAPVPSPDPYADRRAYPRVSVALPAFLQANGERHQVHLLDVSAGGAKLNCAVSLLSGTEVVLDCGTLACSAVVRWQNGEFVGVCFDSELDAREVSALADRSKALESRMNTRE